MSRGLPQKVKLSLDKAIESALLAVEIYNKPATKFKSAGFIVLMSIAWTSLFHAIFFLKKIKPFYKDKDKRRYKRINGEYVFWELKTCIDEYFKNNVNAIRKNIEFFIPLRNKIEHKFLPELDPNIFAECQSFLLNFDKILESEFGSTYCIRESLSFALQLFPSAKTLNSCVKPNKDVIEILKFIDKYRSTISTEILKSGEYSFKAFLIQVANHNSATALPIQFFKYDDLSEYEKEGIDRIATIVKKVPVTIPVANKNTFKPNRVVEEVQKGIKNTIRFTLDTHTRCWRKYCVRPNSKATNPTQTNPKYCIYDEPYQAYVYTQAWIDFLIEKMSDLNEYNSLYTKK